MFQKFCIKQGDLWPPLEAYLLQADSEAIPLEVDDTVRFIMTPKNDRRNIIIDAAAQIIDLDTGYVKYNWQQGDTDIPDTYQAEFLIMLHGDTPIRVPNNGYFIIIIDHKLGYEEQGS